MSDAASVITWGREVLANRRMQKRNESQPVLQQFHSSQSVSSQPPTSGKPASRSARSTVSIQSSLRQPHDNGEKHNSISPRSGQQPRSGTQTRQHSSQFLPQTLAPPPDDDPRSARDDYPLVGEEERMDDGGHVYQQSGVREDSSTARSPALLLHEPDRRSYADDNVESEFDAVFGGRTTGRQSVQSKKSGSASSTPQALAETTKLLEIEALQRRLDAEKWQLKELRAVKVTNEKAFHNREQELHSLLELAYRHRAAEGGGAHAPPLLNTESQRSFASRRGASPSNALSVKQPLQQATLEELWESQRLLLDGLEEEEILGGALVELTDVVTDAGGKEKSIADSFFQALIAMKLRVLPSLRTYGANVSELMDESKVVDADGDDYDSYVVEPDRDGDGDAEDMGSTQPKRAKLSHAVAAALRPIDDARLPETDSVQNLPPLKKVDAALSGIGDAVKAVTITFENLGRLSSAVKQAQADELRKLRDSLTTQRKRLDGSSETLKNRQDRHAALIAERAQLREDAKALEKQTLEKQEEIKRVKGSNEEKKRNMTELEAAVSQLRQKKQKAVFYRKDLDDEIARCKSEAARTSGIIDDYRQTLAAAESATESRRMELIKAKHELQQARQDEERCSRARSIAEQENSRVQERLQELRSSCKAVEHDISDMDDRTTQNAFDDANLKRKIAAVEHECVSVREASAALRDDTHAIRESMDELSREIAIKQAALEKEASTLLELQEELKVAQAVLLYRDEVPKLNPEQRAEWLSETRELLRVSALSPARVSSQLKRSSAALSPDAALTPGKDAADGAVASERVPPKILSPTVADSDSMSTPQRSTMPLDGTISPTLIHYDLTTPYDKPAPSLLFSPSMEEQKNGASHPAHHAPIFSEATSASSAPTAPFQPDRPSSTRTRKSDKPDGSLAHTTATSEQARQEEVGLVTSDVLSSKVSSSSESKTSVRPNSMHVVPQQRYEQRDYDELTRVHEEQWHALREEARYPGQIGNRRGDHRHSKPNDRHYDRRHLSSRGRSATTESCSTEQSSSSGTSSDGSHDSPSPTASVCTEESSPYHFTYSSSPSSSPSPEAVGIPSGSGGGARNTRTVPRVVSRPSRSDFTQERRKADDLSTTQGLLYCDGSPLTSYNKHRREEKKNQHPQAPDASRHLEKTSSPKVPVDSRQMNSDRTTVPHADVSAPAKHEEKASQQPSGTNTTDGTARRHHDSSVTNDSFPPSSNPQTNAMRERLELLRKKISQRDNNSSGPHRLR